LIAAASWYPYLRQAQLTFKWHWMTSRAPWPSNSTQALELFQAHWTRHKPAQSGARSIHSQLQYSSVPGFVKREIRPGEYQCSHILRVVSGKGMPTHY
jgi:hypothetical protein